MGRAGSIDLEPLYCKYLSWQQLVECVSKPSDKPLPHIRIGRKLIRDNMSKWLCASQEVLLDYKGGLYLTSANNEVQTFLNRHCHQTISKVYLQVRDARDQVGVKVRDHFLEVRYSECRAKRMANCVSDPAVDRANSDEIQSLEDILLSTRKMAAQLQHQLDSLIAHRSVPQTVTPAAPPLSPTQTPLCLVTISDGPGSSSEPPNQDSVQRLHQI
jgi:hypothetical protein